MLLDRGALAFLAPSNSLLSRRRLIVTETLPFRRDQLPRRISGSPPSPGYFSESNLAIVCCLSMILEGMWLNIFGAFVRR